MQTIQTNASIKKVQRDTKTPLEIAKIDNQRANIVMTCLLKNRITNYKGDQHFKCNAEHQQIDKATLLFSLFGE